MSRALTEIHQCDKVLGVSHGVQPATGAPATYKRMRAGFESVEQIFLGRKAADVVAILAQAPGGLELLPTADYNDGKPWLKIRERATQKEIPFGLPENYDPYMEIYRSGEWYGLVPDSNLSLLNPAGVRGLSVHVGEERNEEAIPRDKLDRVIEGIRIFHKAIEKKYKDPTYAHYGAQGGRDVEIGKGSILCTGFFSACDRFAWGEVAWEGVGLSGIQFSDIKISGDDGNGILSLSNGARITIAKPDCPGDGTVPILSGEASAKAGIAMSFSHGQQSHGKHNSAFGYDHQGSYGDKEGRSLYATMFAIVKIAQGAAWHRRKK